MSAAGQAPTIQVPEPLPHVLAKLTDAVGGPVVLVGGWAVHCRLRMGRSETRPTEDLDVVVPAHLRPARAALESIQAIQDDPTHPCRINGLALQVDLLADDDPPMTSAHQQELLVEDPDGLRLLRPLQGQMLVRSAEQVTLTDGRSTDAQILLPRAGPLLAAKVANLTLEDRGPKLASDAEDVVRLSRTFGTGALLEDLSTASQTERRALRRALQVVGARAVCLLADVPARDERRLQLVFDDLVGGLGQAGT